MGYADTRARFPIMGRHDGETKTMIDEDRTMQLFGYTSDDLLPKSNKKIVAVCEECGKYRVLVKNGCRDLCRSCAGKGRIISEEHKLNLSKALKGKKYGKRPPLTQEWKDKMSKSKKGKGTKLKGQPKSLEYRQNLSAVNLGIPREDWTGFSDSNRPHVLPMGQCIKVNKWFAGSHAHHITKSIVVYIPGELHNHIPHNIRTGTGMGEMNMTAIQYVNGGMNV